MSDDITEKIRELHANGLGWDAITDKLSGLGYSEEEWTQAISQVKKEKYQKNKNTGMVLIMIGSALCFFSMVYTFFYGHNYFMLYGLTMIGVGVAFAGLVYVMG